jgi:hypothetical protein
MFSAYMQEVNLKKIIMFNLVYLFSVSDPMYAQEISASIFIELCLGVVVSET